MTKSSGENEDRPWTENGEARRTTFTQWDFEENYPIPNYDFTFSRFRSESAARCQPEGRQKVVHSIASTDQALPIYGRYVVTTLLPQLLVFW